MSSDQDHDEAMPVPVQIVSGVLIATPRPDLGDAAILQLRGRVLSHIQRHRVRAVIIDVAAVEVVDTREIELLRDTLTMASVMGARALLAGIGPGVAAALAVLDEDSRPISTAINLEAGLAMLASPCV